MKGFAVAGDTLKISGTSPLFFVNFVFFVV